MICEGIQLESWNIDPNTRHNPSLSCHLPVNPPRTVLILCGTESDHGSKADTSSCLLNDTHTSHMKDSLSRVSTLAASHADMGPHILSPIICEATSHSPRSMQKYCFIYRTDQLPSAPVHRPALMCMEDNHKILASDPISCRRHRPSRSAGPVAET